MPHRLLALGTLLCVALPVLAGETIDWNRLDWRLDRSLLVSRYLFHDIQPATPWEEYTSTLGPDENSLADLLAEFDALPPERRQRARESAAGLLKRARIAVLDRAIPLRTAVEENRVNYIGDFMNPTPGFGNAITTAIERLADAVRRDPTLAEAWYHLAYFTGLAGDHAREARAHAAFFAVLPRLDAEKQADLAFYRDQAILDRAWALRDAGNYDECLAWLDEHRPSLSRDAEKPVVPPATEALLIRALVHAERGEVAPAQAALQYLPLMSLPDRATAPHQGYVHQFNQRLIYYQRFHQGNDPIHNVRHEVKDTVADNMVREHRSSSYLRRWVKGWTSLRRGYDPETVRRDLGRVELELEFQPRLAARWWQDQGLIYEILGDNDLAEVCWARAAVYRPFFIYYPVGQGRGIRNVHGHTGTGRPYFLGYGTFFLSGSIWSYAANAALASQVETDALERTYLRQIARDHLDACIRRGLHAADARALRGRLAFLDEDYAGARTDLEAAWTELEASGTAPADLTLMIGLCDFNREDWSSSLPWLNAFTRRSPDNHVGWLALGLAQASLADDDKAFANLDRAVELAPDDPTCLYNRGLLHYRLHRRNRARDDFLRAKDRWPENPQIQQMVRVVAEEAFYDLQVAVTPLQMDLPESQRQHLASVLRNAGGTGPAEILADLVAADNDQRASIMTALEQRHRDDPSPVNRLRLAQASLVTGAADRTQKLLAPLWPDRLQPLERRLLLWADRDQGTLDRAVDIAANLDRADLADRADNIELMTLAATILLDHDRRQEATRLVQHALGLEPGNAVLQELQRVLERSQ